MLINRSMSTKDPEVTKLKTQNEKLEKYINSLLLRVAALEREVKRLRGTVGRTTDQLGTMGHQLRKAMK